MDKPMPLPWLTIEPGMSFWKKGSKILSGFFVRDTYPRVNNFDLQLVLKFLLLLGSI